MYKLLSVLLLFFTIQTSISQQNLEQFKDSIERVNLNDLSSISRKYLFKIEHEPRMEIISDVILKKLNEHNFNEEEVLKAYRTLYLNYYFNNNFKKTIEYGHLSKITALKINNHHYECLANIILGQSYFDIGDYDLSIKHHVTALQIATQYDILNLKIATKANIGKFKLVCNDFNGAIEILERSINETESSNLPYLKSFYPETYSDLTLAHIEANNFEKAKYYNKLGKIYSIRFNYYLSVNLVNEAIIEMYAKNYNIALKIVDSSRNINERNHDKFNLIASQYLTKGKIYFYKKDYENALKELLKLEKLEKQNRIHHLSFQEGFSYIAKTYAALGKNNLALNYYKKALKTFTESEKNKVELISEITDKYDENQIDQILKNENLVATEFIHQKHATIEKEIQKLNAEKEEKNNYLLIIISVFTIIIIAFVVYNLKTRQKNKQKLEFILSKKAAKKILKPDVIKLKDSEIERIIENLNQLEKQKFYLKTDCTATNLAKKLETNTTYLSKTINSYYQKSFTNYINDLRINYVLDRLKNDKLFRRYSIQSIANEIGFKSRESFNKVFKKETGILPSYFIKELNNKLGR